MILFKNLLAYRLTAEVDLSAERLQEALQAKLARMPADNELSTYGFITPLPRVDGQESTVLAHANTGNVLVCAEKQLKKPKGRLVADEVQKRVDAIQLSEDRTVRGRERAEIKDQVLQGMLIKLIPEPYRTYALLMPKDGLILVNTSNPKVAEDLLSTLREVLGSLPIRPLTTRLAPASCMTQWLKASELPESFSLLGSAILAGVEKGSGRVQLTDQDLTTDEVKAHIDGGLQVKKLLVAYKDQLQVRLSDTFALEAIKYEDVVLDETRNAAGDGDKLQTYDASLAIMAGTFSALLPSLTEAFGGELVRETA